MKNLILLFLIFLSIASCRKDPNPEPDLTKKIVGEFYGTKTVNNITTDETWKITKRDFNHVNVTFFLSSTYPDGSVTHSKYDVYIPDVTVSENNILKFDNKIVFDKLKYRVTGEAYLINDSINYDITMAGEYNTLKLVNKIYRR